VINNSLEALISNILLLGAVAFLNTPTSIPTTIIEEEDDD
jgi:hypothetical protein